ncbi:MAG: hypothetical protein LBJ00_02980 [Planctomycetaceae bacterium]|nr:hypothetical protein [Planctomycetaceae bacterium]
MNKNIAKSLFETVFTPTGMIRFMSLVVLLFCTVSCVNLAEKFGAANGNTGTGLSLLRDGDVPVDTVAVEIFNIHITPDNERYLDELWFETDEQIIPPSVRLDLYRNGIRVGVQGSLISSALSRLINVSGNPDKPRYINGMREIAVAEMSREMPVSRQFQNLFPGTRVILKPFETAIYELSLFENDRGQVWGKTYTNAQGQFVLTAKPADGGKVKFEVVPELEYGLPETKMYSRQGIMFTETSKPRRIYDSLRVSADLLPGNWLILGPTLGNCGGAGRCFFIRGDDQIEQRIVAIRLINLKRPNANTTLPKSNSPDYNANNTMPERK